MTARAAAITALQHALAAEQAACYGYGVIGAHLASRPAGQAAAGADWVAHMQVRDELSAMISTRGGDPVASAVAYQLPFPVTSPVTAIRLAATMEDRVAQVYQELVALTDTGLRSFGAIQVRAAALRAQSWRGTTEPFPGLPGVS